MPSLNLDLNYFDNIKTIRLRARLGDGADVLPIKLWAYCGKHHPDHGVLRGFLIEEIEEICGWWGIAGQLVEALVELKFLEKVSEGWKVHDWLDHEGHLATFRERARTAALARWGPPGDASSIAQASGSNAASNAPTVHSSAVQGSTDHSSTDTGAREEYRIPEPKEAPIDALIMRFKVLKGVPYEHVGWDERWKEYYRPFAEKLLRDCGSYSRAYACLEHYAALFAKRQYQDWTLRAVAERAVEWAGAQGGKQHGTSNSTRFFEALRQQRAVGKEDPGLRATSEAGAVLNAVRDHAAAASGKAGAEDAGSANGHGRAVAGVQRPAVEGEADRGKSS